MTLSLFNDDTDNTALLTSASIWYDLLGLAVKENKFRCLSSLRGKGVRVFDNMRMYCLGEYDSIVPAFILIITCYQFVINGQRHQ